MRNNLFNFWATVLKKYLKTKKYRDNDDDLDLILRGDLYSLPHTLETKYKVKNPNDPKYDFFEDLFAKIQGDTQKNIDWNSPKYIRNDLSSSKLREYHGIVYNSSHKYDKRIKDENYEILLSYIHGEDPIRVKKPVVDWWKFNFILLSLLSICLFGYFLYKSSNTNKDNSNLIKSNSTNRAIINGFLNDKYSTFIDPKNSPKELEGEWYSYNKSNEPKKTSGGDSLPYCRIKWNFTTKNNRIMIDRMYKNTKGDTISSYGIAETIHDVYHLHINVFKNNNLQSKRHFICNGVPGNDEMLECLCTMYNTQTKPNDPLLVGREILVKAKKGETLETKNISFDGLPDYVRDYFKDGRIPSYIQMIEEERSRLIKNVNK